MIDPLERGIFYILICVVIKWVNTHIRGHLAIHLNLYFLLLLSHTSITHRHTHTSDFLPEIWWSKSQSLWKHMDKEHQNPQLWNLFIKIFCVGDRVSLPSMEFVDSIRKRLFSNAGEGTIHCLLPPLEPWQLQLK